jgi:hypothetical protein
VVGEVVAGDPAVERGDERLAVAAFFQLELQDLSPDVLGDQATGTSLGHDPPLVHDQEPVAQARGLLHVVRGQQQGHALSSQALQGLPHGQAGLRVEAGRRLVQDDQLGVVDERPGDQQAPLHPPGERLDPVACAVRQVREVQQLLRAPRGSLGVDSEVVALEDQVLANRQIAVQVRLLRDDPDPRLDLAPVRPGVEPQDAQLAALHRGEPVDHLHRRRLAGAVRPQKAEADAGRHVEVDPLHGHAPAVALLEPAGDDRAFFGRARDHEVKIAKARALLTAWTPIVG